MYLSFRKDWRSRDAKAPAVRVLEIKDPEIPDPEKPGHIRARVLVAREEARTEWSATITLHYESFDEGAKGFGNPPFTGKWERFPDGTEKVSLTGGSVMLSGIGVPRGAHVGTYLMDEVVRWAKQWPLAQVRRISLSPVDAENEAVMGRRNRFYEQFCIRFDYTQEGRSGVSLPMTAGELRPVDPSVWAPDIEEYGVVDHLRKARASIRAQEFCIANLKRRDEEHTNACARPLRWALGKRCDTLLIGIFLIFIVTVGIALILTNVGTLRDSEAYLRVNDVNSRQ